MGTMKKVLGSLLLLLLGLTLLGNGVSEGFGDDSSFDSEEEWDIEESLSGRDFVELGELATIEGILLTEDGEWFLQTEDDLYEVHLGDHDYREEMGIHLVPGDRATIYGYLYDDDMAVVSLTIDEETYYFRTEQGTPLWGAFGGGEERQEVLQRLERRAELERALQQQLEEELKEEKMEEEKED